MIKPANRVARHAGSSFSIEAVRIDRENVLSRYPTSELARRRISVSISKEEESPAM